MKSILLSISLLLALFPMTENPSRPKLIYVGDPMCSWCYGFAPQITQTLNELGDEVDFQLVLGGLRPYTKEVMDQKLKKFLHHHWEEINKRTGQEFRYDILDVPGFVYDTEPACRAVVCVREIAPEKTLAFFKGVQKGFYYDNRNPLYAESYLPLLREMKIDEKRFLELFNKEESKNQTRQDFQIAQQMGVRGFPSVLLLANDSLFVLSNGYTTSDQLVKAVRERLK